MQNIPIRTPEVAAIKRALLGKEEDTMIKTPLTLVDLEYENGQLVKIHGQRPQYMSGDDLIKVVHQLGRIIAEQQQTLNGE